ncbi:MAG: protein-glutamate O-methyltransferase CheR [Paracoccus sp. (in: a-proteobacteria)]|nr:protein-glutamate O-methyltransferase CheR [Paracoccus sp. (in: a-proteobacteria)]
MNHQAHSPVEWSMTDQEFDALRQAIHEFAGIVIGPEKRSMIRSRLRRRFVALQLSSLTDYLYLIRQPDGSAERQNFISSLTTNVTSFFREQHHFDLLINQILPPERNGYARLNIWSAGCSSGQEPYSIALAIHDKRPDLVHGTKILATDIDHGILEQAKARVYARKDVEGLPPTMLSRYFQSIRQDDAEAEEMRLSSSVSNMVTFRQLNLNTNWIMPRQFDAIFCRNVAIYFDQQAQKRLWQRFLGVLRPGGWLLIGHSERIQPELHDMLRPGGMTAYQKAP